MSGYSSHRGACNLSSCTINEQLKTEIQLAFSLLGDDPPSPTRSIGNASDAAFIVEEGNVVLHDAFDRKKTIRRVSDLPFRDVVLNNRGNRHLTDEAITYIKKFTMFIKRTNISFTGGRFTCPEVLARKSGTTCSIVADRPCPLYYSATQAPLRASSVEPLLPERTNGRVLVHLDPNAEPIPDEYKREVVYAGIGDDKLFFAPLHTYFIAAEYEVEGVACYLCREKLLHSESGLHETTFVVATCGNRHGCPRLVAYDKTALGDAMACECGNCPVNKFEDGNLVNIASGDVAGKLIGIRMLTTDEELLWDASNDKVLEMNQISDKFPNTMSLRTLAGMLRLSEVQTAATVSLAAWGNNPWAAEACYTGLAGSDHVGKGCLTTCASSLSLCTWELPEGTFNLASGRLLYIDRMEGNTVHIFGDVKLSDAEMFRPSEYPDLRVCGLNGSAVRANCPG